MTPADRSALLNRFIGVIKQNAQGLVYLEVISSGGSVSRIGNLDLLMMVDAITISGSLDQSGGTSATRKMRAPSTPEASSARAIAKPWLPMVMRCCAASLDDEFALPGGSSIFNAPASLYRLRSV